MAQINTQEFLKVVSKQQGKGNGQASKQVKKKEKGGGQDKGQGA